MKQKGGFTLFELLVVISIVGVLVGLVTISFSSAQKRARDARRREDLQALQKALEQYYALSGGNYPNPCYTSGSLSYGGTTLMNNFPSDPKPGWDSYSATNCNSSGYCYCAHLEATTTGGNATNASCNWGSGAYFCISNRQ